MSRYIVDHKLGPRLVTTASAALDFAERGYKVWRVVTTERVSANDLGLEVIEESLPDAPELPSDLPKESR